MIKVNLSKNLVVGSLGEGGGELSLDSSSQKKAIINALIFLIFPVLAKGVEMYQEHLIKQENQVLNAKLTTQKNEISRYEQTSREVEKLLAEKAELDQHLAQIAGISQDRLLPLKALDALPSLVPPKTWLNTLELSDGPLEGESTSQSQGTQDRRFRMRVEAYSLNPDGAALFLRAFEESIFFLAPKLLSSTRETSPMGDVTKFALEVGIGDGF